MRNLLLTIAFDGRDFHGWQVQENAVTVQGVLQEALAEVLGVRPDVKGCSRTDSGVHARMFCLSFKSPSAIPCDGLVRALNAKLPDTIAASNCIEVACDFHGRYSVKEKQYTYEIHNSSIRNPFLAGRAWRYPFFLDAGEMTSEGQALAGKHDFTSFCASGGKPMVSNVRSVSGLTVVRTGDMVTLSVTADGFLYNMVRIIVGTLCDIQRGVIPRGSLPEILAARDRKAAGVTAPAEGLYLNRVIYS